jgi:double-stranded uracil-DNA glycosylase
MTQTKTGLAPVLNERVKLLILGSFPGEQSLTKQEYYGNPFNSFWKIMGSILETDMVGKPYDERIAVLLENKIGLWDVYGSCEREGSLDTAIQKGEHNDFSLLRAVAPKLKKVCFNGKTAGKYASMLAAMGYKTVILPSTSSANRNSTFEEKRKAWSAAIP